MYLILKTILKTVKIINIIFLFCAFFLILLSIFAYDFTLIAITFHFIIIYYIGVIGSFIIHEWAHFKLLDYLKIPYFLDVKPWRMSFVTLKKMTPKVQIIISLSGPFFSGLIGFLLLFINYFLNSGIINFLAYLYLAHLLFLFPIFGDGRSILHAIYNHFRRKKLDRSN
ncbi:hypothetical protein UAO_01995 [Enterococcus villorum ATCC 700913]|uniref:Zincin peptidase n=1 Tax=Enterococcus villorum ATCC 700913 TaxID=1158604 RepID=A0ABP2UT01_9ENTE|nr:hypothetical protein UAO_01995 [Enterococcus villorum ATCC 700913]EOW76526.1 hypothetical protein I591_01831 [Enterococcus villorum ATCC 700913]